MAGEETGEGWWQVREARGGMAAGEGRKGRDVMATGEGGRGGMAAGEGGRGRGGMAAGEGGRGGMLWPLVREGRGGMLWLMGVCVDGLLPVTLPSTLTESVALSKHVDTVSLWQCIVHSGCAAGYM